MSSCLYRQNTAVPKIIPKAFQFFFSQMFSEYLEDEDYSTEQSTYLLSRSAVWRGRCLENREVIYHQTLIHVFILGFGYNCLAAKLDRGRV